MRSSSTTSGITPFNPPGHKQGRGADRRVVDVVGEGVFRSDVLGPNGLDDRPPCATACCSRPRS